MPLQGLVNAYPFLACLFATTSDRQLHEPIFTNAHYRSLIRNSEGNTIPWLKALGTPAEVSRFAEWLASTAVPLLTVHLRPYPGAQLVSLQLCKTFIDKVWVITATPLPLNLDIESLTSSRQLSPVPDELADLSNGENEVVIHATEYCPVTKEELEGFIASFDWSTTPMGSPENWPQSLKTLWSVAWSHEGPAAVLWGEDQVILYNAHYASTILAKKHPAAFGKKCIEAWGEIWETHGPLAAKVMNEGVTLYKTEDLFFFDRIPSSDGLLPEEVYYTWSWVPAKGENNKAVGIMNVCFDTTDKTLGERRMQCLQNFSERGAVTRTRIEWTRALINVLEESTYEAPFAAIYAYSSERSISEDVPLGVQKIHLNYLALVDAIGIPEADGAGWHPLARPYFRVEHRDGTLWPSSPNDSVMTIPTDDHERPSILDRYDSDASTIQPSTVFFDWTPHFARAHRSQHPILVSNLPPGVMTNVGRDRCWHDVVREALLIPITVESCVGESGSGSEENVASAILILGVNTRVPYTPDSSYGHWAEIMRLTLSSSLTAVIGREREAQHLEKMAKLDTAKTAFFSNTSHELRTPLTLLAGPIKDALDLAADGELKGKLELASRAVSRLQRLVDSLMDFTKIIAGQLQGHFRPYHLGRMVADLAAMFRSVIKSRSIEYIVDCDLTEERLTLVDPDAVERIVFNLIGNALKFTSSGRIIVRVVYGQDTVTLSVADTGVGIPPNALEEVFERFHRVQTTDRSYEGTGIGLALSAELVKFHGGSLTVKSTLQRENSMDHGSTFFAEFPMGMDHLPWSSITDDDPHSNIHLSYSRGILREAAQWRPGTATPSISSEPDSDASVPESSSSAYAFKASDLILVVDDNADMLEYMRSIFMPFCRVATATHGQQALDLMNSHRPGLVISDISMPVLSGIELCSAIRADSRLRLIPLILLTAQVDEVTQLQGLAAGADDYLAKPFSSRELLARAHLQLQIGKERFHLQGQFDASLQELRVLTELAPVGIIRADCFRNIIWANPAWYELMGVPNDVSLNAWVPYVHPDDLNSAIASWNSVFDYEQPQTFEVRFLNGNILKIEITTFRDPDGVFCAMGTLTDITEIRRLQGLQLTLTQEREAVARRKAEEAEERRIEAEDRRKAQELLIDVTSHELRQPISACLNSALLVRSNLGGLFNQMAESLRSSTPFHVSPALLDSINEDLQALDSMYESCLSQERIANDVLSLSRLQLEVLSIDPTSFDLIEEVRRTCAIFSKELQIKNIHFTLEIGKSFEHFGVRWVTLDRARLSQVITNLLTNAIKFTAIGKGEHRIHLTLNVSEDKPVDSSCEFPPLSHPPHQLPESTPLFIYIAVRDSGPGLKPGDLALLFQRFAQGSNSHEVFGGSGLGLFVSRKLCDLMGGRIEVISEYGQGATFRFFVQAMAGGVPSVNSTLRVPNAVLHAQNGFQEGLRVLITEDNQINQKVLDRQLKKAGCLTSLASNGLEALEAVKRTHRSPEHYFHVILMDCEMPVMDGYTAVRELRHLEASGELARRHYVIALTGNARSAQVQSALDAGMDEVVIKPYKINDLLQLMYRGANR